MDQVLDMKEGREMKQEMQMQQEPEKKQVQCADCWRWIDADKNHTCRQQVKRNQRGAK